MPNYQKFMSDLGERISAVDPGGVVERRKCVNETERFALLLRECGPAERGGLKQYGDPLRYFTEVLHVVPFPAQEEVLAACGEPPFRISVQSGQSFGKSFLGGGLVNYRYDCFGGITTTTAPTKQSVEDILWKEVRDQRSRNPMLPWDFIGPVAPMLRKSQSWWARGFVAESKDSFKGRHVEYMCFIFDEAVALGVEYFRATKGMFQPFGKHLWLSFCNPTDKTSALYAEVERGGWREFSLSCLDHPNILAVLDGKPPPIPPAVSYGQVEEAVAELCEPVLPGDDLQVTDFAWPMVRVGDGWTADPHEAVVIDDEAKIWRPGPDMASDWLGLWPEDGPHQIWPDALWKACTEPANGPIPARLDELPRIGIDTATTGDHCGFHCRWGLWSIRHEEKHGIRPTAIKGHAIELATWCADLVNKAIILDGGNRPLCDPKTIPIIVDDDGVGRSVCDFLHEDGYTVYPINAATNATLATRYPNKRSELWFQTRDKGYKGLVRFGRLPKRVLDNLKRQFVSVQWELNSAGQRVVEKKEDTVERLGRSPDGADSINLAFHSIDSLPPVWVPSGKGNRNGYPVPGHGGDRTFKRLFGRK